MKKIFSVLIVLLSFSAVWAQGGSGEGYDPSNPPDPQANYKMTVQASPARGGNTSPSGTWMQPVGEELYIWASPNQGYTFRAWMKGDEVISKDPEFHYTMPKENVVLTAWFDFTGYGDYNPENPGDPWSDGYMHWIRAYNSPSVGGWINGDNFRVKEGETVTIYAYPHSGFRFSNWKKDGKIISTNQALEIKMGTEDLEYTASYVYDPENPGNPGANSWNRGTGQLIIDDFEPGNLWDAVWKSVNDGEDFELVDNITVIGQINPYDFGVCNWMPNLVTADFSRTTGANFVPYLSFSYLYSLTRISLPAAIQWFEFAALNELSSLSELVMYAIMPPTMSYDSFWYMPSDLVVKVYSGSVDLYENAEYWKNYKIMAMDGDATNLTVNLPEDAKDGRYRNASLQLNNLKTGQSSKLIINGTRTQYVFGNLIPDMKYSLHALAPNGTVLGQFLEFEIPEKGETLTFTSLRQLHEVRLSLLTPAKEDIAPHVAISWLDNHGKVIGSGASLPAQVTGESVSYEIILPAEYGVLYATPERGDWTVTDSDNAVTVELKELAPVELSGSVRSVEGENIQGAYVTVSQTLNGSYSVSSTVASGNDGKFTVKAYDAPGSVTAGSPDYLEGTFEFRDLAEAKEAVNLLLKPIGGTEINLSLLQRDNILRTSTDNTFSTYKDYANVEFEVVNLTTGNTEPFVTKYPRLVLSDDVKDGERLRITATPGKGNLNAATEEVTVSGGKAEVKFAFTTNGDIAASYDDSGADEVVGLLYDSRGNLHSTGNYLNKSVTFKYVPAGTYRLVTSQRNKMISSIGLFDDFASLPYEAGKDYLVNEVTVEDGYITPVVIGEVPELDETAFVFTTPETSLSVNKMNVTVGATVTVRTKVEFLPEYAGVDKVRIIYTIPEGCEYVDNSLLVPGSGATFTTIDGNHLTVDVAVKDASPRFCIIPRLGADYRPSAVIEFEHNGMSVRQPIGSALFTAGDFTISVPDRTGTPTITARGTTVALSEIRVYDNDVYVGSTHSLSNGDWRLKFDLFNPGEDGTEHLIYASIKTPDGLRYNTVTGKTTYYHGTGILTDIIMIYGGTEVDFNHVDASTEPISYSYVPGNDMFTFMAQFRDGLGASIKKLDFVILLSDGSRRTISGKYLVGTETWTCALSFPDVNKLPVNVKVIYSENPADTPVDDIEEIWRCPDVIPIIDPSGYVYEAVHSNRIPGVTSTIYYRELTEDNYGDVIESAVKWDAEAYAQENPLFTDEDGMYQWDVPSGEWQVRFEKEGYEAARTEWLPVPPPQLDVNVAITQMSSPEVRKAVAYPSAVMIEFDKYMEPLTLNHKNIKVTVNGAEVAGQLELVNEEEGENGARYTSEVLFKADEPFEGECVNLMISRVKSYAGVQIEGEFSQEFDIQTPVTDIVSPEETKAYIGYDKMISVAVEPAEAAAGKKLFISVNTPILTVDEAVELDDEGKAQLNLVGILPGKAQLTYTVEDFYSGEAYTTDVTVDIVSAELPMTSIESGTPVYRNGQVAIFTDSNIGEIYYTLDGSTPTTENGILYEGPITISDETEIKAVNVINDAVYSISDVAAFIFPLKKASLSHSLGEGWNWISHNLENAVKVDVLTPADKLERIMSQTDEAIRDPKYGLMGTLKELTPESGYKVLTSGALTLTGAEDVALHPSTPYTVYKGWNWIGFHGEKEMQIGQALSGTAAETGDIIVGREGFATYNGENWLGELVSLEPGAGYLYYSKSVKNVAHDPAVQGIAMHPQTSAGAADNGEDAEMTDMVDKSKYPSVMPVIAELRDKDGTAFVDRDLEVMAFSEGECRGAGSFFDGMVFMSVYGNNDEEIRFVVRHREDRTELASLPAVRFTEEGLGDIEDPYVIYLPGVTGSGSVAADDSVSVQVSEGVLIIRGHGILSLAVSDANGVVRHADNGNVSDEIHVGPLTPGIYLVTVETAPGITRHKIMVR